MSTELQPAAAPAGFVARLIDLSARRRFVIYVITLGLAIWGGWSAVHSQLDALPDLSDTQVIVATEWMGRSPTLIENQITYPIVTTFLGAPNIKTTSTSIRVTSVVTSRPRRKRLRENCSCRPATS